MPKLGIRYVVHNAEKPRLARCRQIQGAPEKRAARRSISYVSNRFEEQRSRWWHIDSRLEKVKLQRAYGGCLGAKSRRRTR